MSRTFAPDVYIWRASVATSMQTVQSRPCGSHAVTSPFSSRAATKQSWFPLCPPRSQPQKQGTYSRISGCSAAKKYASRTTLIGRGGANCCEGSGGRFACLCGPNFAQRDEAGAGSEGALDA